MKSIMLSVVVVCALAIAGIGGTFATWSDSETSPDNYIETGSVDLLVNDADDGPWGSGVPTSIDVGCIIPCKWYGPFPVKVWNASQDCMPPSHLFIHVKDVCCVNTPPKAGSGYEDPFSGQLKPEPELVAEYGGKVNCTEVPGVGVLGDDCTLADYIGVVIVKDDPEFGPVLYDGKLGDMVCEEIWLCDLEPCNAQTLYFWIHLQQPPEEEFKMNYIPNVGEPGYDELEWLKFNDWPSWALMKDAISFDMEFDLWLEDP